MQENEKIKATNIQHIKPFLSIIVPIFNAENYLKVCIESIIQQSYANFELILIDDGSTDKSLAICKSFEKKDNRIKVRHIENSGVQRARAYGVSIAVGSYIAFVDADDFLEREFYHKLCNCAILYEVDVVISDFTSYNNSASEKIEQIFEGGLYHRKQIEEQIWPFYICYQKYFEFGFLPALWNKIYRVELLKKYIEIANCTIRIGEDAAIFYPLMLEVTNLYYLKGEYGYYYRQGNDSASTYITNKDLDSSLVLADVLWDRMQQNFIYITIKKQFYTYIIYMLSEAVVKNWTYLRKRKNFKEFVTKLKKKNWYVKKWQSVTDIEFPHWVLWINIFLESGAFRFKILLDIYFFLIKQYKRLTNRGEG